MQKRKLGLSEYYSKYCHDHANGSTLLSGMIQIEGPLWSEIVKKALLIMQKRHSILRSYFAGSTRKADYLAVDEKISVVPFFTIKRESDTHWKDVMESSSMTLFSSSDRYLWRCVLLEGKSWEHEIIVTFHHAISDGISVSVFMGELIDKCSCIFFNEKLSDTDVLPLMPPVEELLLKKISWRGFLFNVILISGKFIKHIRHLNRFEKNAPLEKRRHRNVYREISNINAYNLIGLCRENNTTITALLSAVLCRAVGNVKKKNIKNAVQVMVTPVNVRERCCPAVARNHIGCYVDFINTVLSFDKGTSLWELSRLYREQLIDGIEHGGHMPVKYSKSLVRNIFSNMGKGILKDVFHYGVGVTNIGKVDFKAHCGPYKIKYFSFCTGRQWGDWMILLHTVTVEDRMYLCFCYAEPLVSPDTVNLIADHVINLLSSLDKKTLQCSKTEENEFDIIGEN